MSPPYVPTEPGALGDEPIGPKRALSGHRSDEEALTAEDLRIARLVQGLVAAEIKPHVVRLEMIIKTANLSDDERQWARLAIQREARIERFRSAVIEKTLTALIWAGIVGLGALLWRGFKHALGQD